MEYNEKNINGFLMEIYSNPELKENFVNSPEKVLREKGFDIPDGLKINVLEDTKEITHFVLPYLDTNEKASIENLEARKSKSYVGWSS